jgi:NAD(P)-dependent dehydrogenase (short-subunit alcohol dehydrogenase family)
LIAPFPSLDRPSYTCLKDKNVVFTGGSRGLGLGLVEALVDLVLARNDQP